jgi:hypothetical protein
VIDLSRMPSSGRDIPVVLRTAKTTRLVPLVLAGGDPGKVARIRRLLPDAGYASWPRIGPALARALAQAPGDPVVPTSVFAGYSGTPLPKKLGIKPSFVVSLLNAPAGFEKVLGPLPAGAALRRTAGGRRDLTLWFVRNRRILDVGIGRMARDGAGGLWILWPKKTSALAADLTPQDVRAAGLRSGLVDYKVCAVDETWSGLKFVARRRREPRHPMRNG